MIEVGRSGEPSMPLGRSARTENGGTALPTPSILWSWVVSRPGSFPPVPYLSHLLGFPGEDSLLRKPTAVRQPADAGFSHELNQAPSFLGRRSCPSPRLQPRSCCGYPRGPGPRDAFPPHSGAGGSPTAFSPGRRRSAFTTGRPRDFRSSNSSFTRTSTNREWSETVSSRSPAVFGWGG